MNRIYFEVFLEKMMALYAQKTPNDNDTIKDLVEAAKELAKYGERRIALENLLENVFENNIILDDELLDAADKAFGENASNYDKELLKDIAIMKNKD